VTDRHPTDVRQYFTHTELVGQAAPPAASPGTPTLDAIIVPASRPADNLGRAITLARAADCQLILLCSRQTRAGDVSQLLATRSFDQATVIDLPDGYRHDLFDFSTSSWAEMCLPEPCATRGTDLSAKRNVGLMLARLLGWKRIFFLDDDISGFDSSDLRSTISMLGRYSSVGMRVTNFPDNSVMCHAHRETGGFQDVHLSGSALVVDCAAPIGFFPDTYNEDWLFFYQDAVERRLGWPGLNAKQLRYDPFDDPIRAARQEFGDVLAEGLYGYLHRGGDGFPAGDYWSRFLDARRSFLGAIIDRLQIARLEKRAKIRMAVETAQDCLMQIQPYHCEEYIGLWKDDLSRWDRRLKEIPRLPSIGDALDHLGLVAAEDSSAERAARRVVDMQVPASPVAAPGRDAPALSGFMAASPALPSPGLTRAYARERAPACELAPASRISPAAPGSGAAFTAVGRLFSLPASFVQLCTDGIAALRRRGGLLR
jgi:hypothetical protein